ncbi:hypothetical protein OAT67_03875 [Bacteriovoracaceae bacterium]|nr:hypothetical protein [Bacteriovoracaceae bacterium]
MSLFKVKEKTLEEQLKEVAKKHGITLAELKQLSEGKMCPKYGTKEQLHVRKVKGGKLMVFNISEKYRGEKISIGRKNIKHQKNKSSDSVETKKS